MRNTENLGVPRLVCPSCACLLDLAAPVDGQVVCTACRCRLDLAALVDELALLMNAARAVDAGVELSGVERELLVLLLQGYRVNQIATRVDATVSTVRKRLRRLLAKTGTRSQAELIAACRRSDGFPARPALFSVVPEPPAVQPVPLVESPRRSSRPRT